MATQSITLTGPLNAGDTLTIAVPQAVPIPVPAPVPTLVPTSAVSFSDAVAQLNTAGGGFVEIVGTKISDVFPQTFPPLVHEVTGPVSVIEAWCGGAWDATRRKMYFHGGGHTDYAGNEVYEYDLTTGVFTRLTDPSALDTVTTNAEGLILYHPLVGPRSEHTYAGFFFSDKTDTLWLMPAGSGAWPNSPAGIINTWPEVWEFNPDRVSIRNGISPLSWRRGPDANINASGLPRTVDLHNGKYVPRSLTQ